MNANTAVSSAPNAVPIVAGVAAALLIAAVLSGREWPLISDPRAALGLLVVLGMMMCAGGGIGPAIAEGRWMAPLALVSIVLGIAILAIGGLTLLGVTLPWIAGARQAFVVIAVIGVVKLALTLLDRFV